MRHLVYRATATLALLSGSSTAIFSCRGPRPVGGDSLEVRPNSRPLAFRVPAESDIADSQLQASLRRGRALLRYTRDSLPRNVGNALACVSCHPDDGTRPGVMPWVGVYARFPQYRRRSGTVQVIEDRINDCFERSMNGRPLPPGSRDMRDIVAYMAFLSLGYPVGSHVQGQGLRQLPPLSGDSARGKALFASVCATCHGTDGGGTAVAPPLWGPRSYNIGAGMARVRTAAAFIRVAMPRNAPGTLDDQQAFDLAVFINRQTRPDFPAKALDWPNGDAPPDVAYPTLGASRSTKR